MNFIRRHRRLSAVVSVLLIALAILAAAPLVGWSKALATVVVTVWVARIFREPASTTWRQAWRWHKTVFHYHSMIVGRLVIRYDPASIDAKEAARIARKAESCLTELTEWCGCRLRGRVLIFVLPSVHALQEIFGARYGGLAFCEHRTIVVSANCAIEGGWSSRR
ncbi:MAG TPA: hypothetical protein VNH11_31400 [Pirellulales bacterium]|nr:hypothetical protein [Pirellulales bacterium]